MGRLVERRERVPDLVRRYADASHPSCRTSTRRDGTRRGAPSSFTALRLLREVAPRHVASADLIQRRMFAFATLPRVRTPIATAAAARARRGKCEFDPAGDVRVRNAPTRTDTDRESDSRSATPLVVARCRESPRAVPGDARREGSRELGRA